MKYLPNVLTIGRILVTPVVLVLLFSDTLLGQTAALALFILAAVTDYYDGKLARSMRAKSRLGQFLDPLADKVLVLGTFAVLSVIMPETIPWWGVGLIALRDLAVTVLRMWAEARGHSLRTLSVAKTKTAMQLVVLIGILLLRIVARLPGALGEGGRWLLESPVPFALFMVLVIFTVVTGIIYLVRQEYAALTKQNG